MKKIVNWLKNEESGQGMVEYGLILALVAIVVIAALNILGDRTANKMNEVANSLN
jgi:pilus assembly protein Flp/PilA